MMKAEDATMATHTHRTHERANGDAADAHAKAQALNAEFAILQAQAQALLREARSGRLRFRSTRKQEHETA
jgi:hypothetical protein